MGREKITVKVLAESGVLYEGPADALLLPTSRGDVTVLPHHTPLIGLLSAGKVRLVQDGKVQDVVTLSSGILHIHPTAVVVLVNA